MGYLKRGKDVISYLASEWIDNDMVVPEDVIGVEKDTGKMKIGDGVKKWSELEYISGGSGGAIVSCFDITIDGDLTPSETVNFDNSWEEDSNGDYQPKAVI